MNSTRGAQRAKMYTAHSRNQEHMRTRSYRLRTVQSLVPGQCPPSMSITRTAGGLRSIGAGHTRSVQPHAGTPRGRGRPLTHDHSGGMGHGTVPSSPLIMEMESKNALRAPWLPRAARKVPGHTRSAKPCLHSQSACDDELPLDALPLGVGLGRLMAWRGAIASHEEGGRREQQQPISAARLEVGNSWCGTTR